eukprot:1291794-Rhodomonas_salina.1
MWEPLSMRSGRSVPWARNTLSGLILRSAIAESVIRMNCRTASRSKSAPTHGIALYARHRSCAPHHGLHGSRVACQCHPNCDASARAPSP